MPSFPYDSRAPARRQPGNVMAGCLPEHFPVVLAAMEVFFEHDPNILHEVSAATNAPGWLILVSGPLRRRLGLGCTDNLLSSANRANATIGHAVRLILMNVLESRPGTLDRGCMGSLCKVGVCFGEDEERSPWLPFHVTRGFKRGIADILDREFARAEVFHITKHSASLPPKPEVIEALHRHADVVISGVGD